MKKFLIIFILFTANVYAETKIIDCSVNAMVEFGVSSKYIEQSKKKHGEDDFSEIAADAQYYAYEAHEYAKSNNINSIYINLDEIDTVIFKNKKKEVKVLTEGNDWTMWFCNKNKNPEKAFFIDSIDKAKEYFNIK